MNDLLVRKYIQKYLEVKDMIYANLQTILKERETEREGKTGRERERRNGGQRKGNDTVIVAKC